MNEFEQKLRVRTDTDSALDSQRMGVLPAQMDLVNYT